MNVNTTKDIKTALRNGQWAWPGGYPLYFITSDGAALSFDAVRSEYRQVINAIRHRLNDGWRIVSCDINWEDENLICEHTGQRIQSAYGDDEVAA